MPRRRARTSAYNYPSADKINNPTSETALRMNREDIEEQPVPEMHAQGRIPYPRLQWNRGTRPDHSRTFGPLYIHDKLSPEQFAKTLTKTDPQRDMWLLMNGLPMMLLPNPMSTAGIGQTVSSVLLLKGQWLACCTRRACAARSP